MQKILRQALATTGQWFRWYNSFIAPAKISRQSPVIDIFLQDAAKHYNKSLAQLESQWLINRYRWQFNQEDNTLRFTHKKQKLPDLVADAQIIGSYFVQTQLWHWAWSSGHLNKKAAKAARKIKRFGRQQSQVPLFTNPLDLYGRPHYCGFLHGLSLSIAKMQFAYCGKNQEQHVYFLMNNIRLL